MVVFPIRIFCAATVAWAGSPFGPISTRLFTTPMVIPPSPLRAVAFEFVNGVVGSSSVASGESRAEQSGGGQGRACVAEGSREPTLRWRSGL